MFELLFVEFLWRLSRCRLSCRDLRIFSGKNKRIGSLVHVQHLQIPRLSGGGNVVLQMLPNFCDILHHCKLQALKTQFSMNSIRQLRAIEFLPTSSWTCTESEGAFDFKCIGIVLCKT